MNEFLLWSGVAILAMSLVCVYRLAVGPTIVDRIIGANIIGTKTIILLLIMGFLFDQIDMFVDIAFTYALINFMGVIAFSKFIEGKGMHDGGGAS